MSDFEFLFSVFGLLIGLTFIEIAIKFADAIDAHSRRPIGLLTPLLALFVMSMSPATGCSAGRSATCFTCGGEQCSSGWPSH